MNYLFMTLVMHDIPAFRALTNQLALVPNTVCQCSSHESITTPLGSIFLRRFYSSIPDDYRHAENEGIPILPMLA